MANNWSCEMEESAISCVLKDGGLYEILKDTINKGDFWYHPYSWIWESFYRLSEQESNIDIITVQDELSRTKCLANLSTFDGGHQGYDALIYLRDKNDVDVAHCETYAHKVRDDAAKRKIQETAEKMLGWINQGNDSIQILTNSEIELSKISAYAGIKTKSVTQLMDAVDEAVKETELASKQNQKYIETGIKGLDDKIGGLFGGQLMTLAARQGMGKSSLALTFALNVSMYNRWKKKVGIFTFEMPNVEYVNRMISAISGIPYLRLKMGKIYDNEFPLYTNAVEMLKHNNNIMLDDSSNSSMPMIRNKLRKMREWGVEMIILDQLGLVNDRYPGEQEYARIDRLSYQLKSMAREFDIPIVNIQQMNRGIENESRGKSKEPRASDLSQAGESAPDLVVMITHTMEKKVIKSSKLWVVKNRFGATGDIDVKFEAHRTFFRDLTPDELADVDGTPEFMRDDDE